LRALEESIAVMPSRKLTCGSGAVNASMRAPAKTFAKRSATPEHQNGRLR
jgi:hypothetical protein